MAALDFLGFGIIRPFRRDQKADWANAGGVRLVQSAVGQILGTRAASETSQGELPWDDERGSLVHQLRHRNIEDETTKELGRVWAAEALARWEPRVRITDVSFTKESVPGEGEVAFVMNVRFDFIDRNVPGNNVIATGLEVAVPVE